MPNTLKVLGLQLREIWRHFGFNQKFSTVLALLFTVVLMGGLVFWSARPDFRLLYSGLTLKDAAEIREKLSDAKIPVRVTDSGRAILVPSKEVYRSRLLLAADGLPKDTAAGFELFEQPKFGLTDFAQQVNYQRALQGELERSIVTMRGIDGARVLLVMPKDRLFVTEADKQSSASVLLTLGGGVGLNPAQVQSVVQLVSCSVPNLAANAITITDQHGNLLSGRVSGAEDAPLEQANDQFVAQERMESMLTRKAQDILDQALGVGRSIVRVNVDMDLSKVEQRSETYDSENRVVRSESIQSESTVSPHAGGGGVAGVVANIPVGDPAGGTMEQGMSRSKKENVRTEYAIPADITRVVRRGARIEQMSVSVCVARGDTPREAEDLQRIEQLVRNAVGFVRSGTRQDSIEVEEMEFAPITPPEPVQWWYTVIPRLDKVGPGTVALLVLLAVYLFARRAMARLAVEQVDGGVPIQALTGDGYGDGLNQATPMGRQARTPLEEQLHEVSRLAEQDPKSVAAWISSVTQAGGQ